MSKFAERDRGRSPDGSLDSERRDPEAPEHGGREGGSVLGDGSNDTTNGLLGNFVDSWQQHVNRTIAAM